MPTLYILVVTVHVLCAIVWLGGMLFFALAAPILRSIDDEAMRATLFERLGRRFRTVGWISIGLLVVTGVWQLYLRGWWGTEVWGSTVFWSAAVGQALAWKLWIVAVMLTLQVGHDFWLGPSAGRAQPGTPAAIRLRGQAAWVARINALAGILLVYFAARLARGG